MCFSRLMRNRTLAVCSLISSKTSRYGFNSLIVTVATCPFFCKEQKTACFTLRVCAICIDFLVRMGLFAVRHMTHGLRHVWKYCGPTQTRGSHNESQEIWQNKLTQGINFESSINQFWTTFAKFILKPQLTPEDRQ